jgi:hypothetical protein
MWRSLHPKAASSLLVSSSDHGNFADLETRLGPQAAPYLIRYKRAFLVFSATLCAMLVLWLSTLFVKPA